MHPTVNNLNNKKKRREEGEGEEKETYGNRVVVEIRRSVRLFTLIHQNVYSTRWGPRFGLAVSRQTSQRWRARTANERTQHQSIGNLFIFSLLSPLVCLFFAL